MSDSSVKYEAMFGWCDRVWKARQVYDDYRKTLNGAEVPLECKRAYKQRIRDIHRMTSRSEYA